MEYLGPCVPPPVEPILAPETTPYWTPQVDIDDRVRAFIGRLLRTFQRKWRHILRLHYTAVALRVFARAIVLLSTLDFEVHDLKSSRKLYPPDEEIQLPAWEPIEDGILRIGKAYLIVCEAIQEGLSIARRHLSENCNAFEDMGVEDPRHERPHYIILTVRHVMLCRATGPTSLKSTAPEPLFNGDDETAPPLDRTLDYLIWATSSARHSVTTSLRSLPVEIQNMILSHVSVGSVKAAHIGCILNLGSPFLWKDGFADVKMLEEYKYEEIMHIQSLIRFGPYLSGIEYVALSHNKRCHERL